MLGVGIAFAARDSCAPRSTTAPRTERRHVDRELGFSFPVPDGWDVDTQAGEAYRAFLARAAAKDAGAMLELQQKQREVVSLFKKDNTGRTLGRLSVFAAKSTPAEFLGGYLVTLQQGVEARPIVTVHEQKQGHEIRGRRYDLVRLTVDLKGNKVEQELFATAVGEEAVLFSLTAQGAQQLAELKAVMWATTWP